MTSKIAIYCLVLAALIGLGSASAPQRDVTRPEYGYKHYCDKVTYPGFRGSGQWWIDELQRPLPIGWRQMIGRVQGSGPYSTRFSWYSPDKRAPARGEAIGYGQLSTVACFD